MGYFSNSTAGEQFQSKLCAHCQHDVDPENPCPVWGAHLFHNYTKQKDAQDILHMLIPKDKLECNMFIDATPGRCHDTVDMFPEDG